MSYFYWIMALGFAVVLAAVIETTVTQIGRAHV